MKTDALVSAVDWLLKDRVRHGDIESARLAQCHLDALHGEYAEYMVVPLPNAIREIPSASVPSSTGSTVGITPPERITVGMTPADKVTTGGTPTDRLKDLSAQVFGKKE